jgi:hypothetical protein
VDGVFDGARYLADRKKHKRLYDVWWHRKRRAKEVQTPTDDQASCTSEPTAAPPTSPAEQQLASTNDMMLALCIPMARYSELLLSKELSSLPPLSLVRCVAMGMRVAELA